jgi:hypothetical protein
MRATIIFFFKDELIITSKRYLLDLHLEPGHLTGTDKNVKHPQPHVVAHLRTCERVCFCLAWSGGRQGARSWVSTPTPSSLHSSRSVTCICIFPEANAILGAEKVTLARNKYNSHHIGSVKSLHVLRDLPGLQVRFL